MGTRMTIHEINKMLEKKNLDPQLRNDLLKKKKILLNGKNVKK